MSAAPLEGEVEETLAGAETEVVGRAWVVCGCVGSIPRESPLAGVTGCCKFGSFWGESAVAGTDWKMALLELTWLEGWVSNPFMGASPSWDSNGCASGSSETG